MLDISQWLGTMTRCMPAWSAVRAMHSEACLPTRRATYGRVVGWYRSPAETYRSPARRIARFRERRRVGAPPPPVLRLFRARGHRPRKTRRTPAPARAGKTYRVGRRPRPRRVHARANRRLLSRPRSLRRDALQPCRRLRPQAAGALTGHVAQLWRHHALGPDALHRICCLRPRDHALRPRQQLRPRAGSRRAQLRQAHPPVLPRAPRRAHRLDQGRL